MLHRALIYTQSPSASIPTAYRARKPTSAAPAGRAFSSVQLRLTCGCAGDLAYTPWYRVRTATGTADV